MRTGASLADFSAAVAFLNVVAIDTRRTNKEKAPRLIFVIVVTSDREVNFPGLTSGAFLRIRTVFVRKVPPASFPRKREPSWGLATFSSSKKLPDPVPAGSPPAFAGVGRNDV